jgi:hypothetical protein
LGDSLQLAAGIFNIRASDLNPDLTIFHMSELEKLI